VIFSQVFVSGGTPTSRVLVRSIVLSVTGDRADG
jgi:hypothetical protein